MKVSPTNGYHFCSNQWTRTEVTSCSKKLAKSLQPTSESSSIQTTELIVKCHTILEMRSHDLSPHTFRSGLRFWKGPQNRDKKKLFLDLFSELANYLQPTSESSSIQTTEPIVKCHTILEMGSHDLSPHTFVSGFQFC